MKKIVWNELAKIDYHENIDYLLKEWSVDEAITFINDVEEVFFNLKNGNVEYPDTGYEDIKKCVVCKQITLYYKHIDDKRIELLRFWNNYKDKKKLNL
ncbi:MAG: type II toxin-antitoxin system RelE/ParE family toxin [Bacteroidota bacterium]